MRQPARARELLSVVAPLLLREALGFLLQNQKCFNLLLQFGENGKITKKIINGNNPDIYYMSEQLYSASGKVNDILRAYFPEQFGERHFLDYPIGHFFAAVVEMWDNDNKCVKITELSLIKDCLSSGIISEKRRGQLINTFNIREPLKTPYKKEKAA